MTTKTPWNIRLLTTWEEISAPEFQKTWLDLMDTAYNAHVFFHPVLVNVWVETYRPIRDIRPLFVYGECGEQKVIFPLVLWRRNWKNAFLKVVVPAGHSDFDYHDPIFKYEPDADAYESFSKAWLDIVCSKLSFDQILLDGVHQKFIPSFFSIVKSEPCLYWSLKDVPASEGFIYPAKKKLAQDIRRRYKRLQEKGTVKFHRYGSVRESGFLDSISNLLNQHSKRWPNAYKAPGFHLNLLEKGIDAGLISFVDMKSADEHCAWLVAFTYKNRFCIYMPAVHEAYLPYAAGHLSQSYALSLAQIDGMAVVDHLRGGEEYKAAWGGETETISDVKFERKKFGSDVRRAVFQALDKLKNWRR